MIPTVLSIAGLDPSGGAGISADIKTATVMGTYAMTVLTTVTVQHPGEVSRVAPLPAAMVGEQLLAILSSMPIGAIKIGLLGNDEIAQTVMRTLADQKIPIVYDPVLRSTSGAGLGNLSPKNFASMHRLATVICPNSFELDAILGGTKAPLWAIDHQTAILHTGGHSGDDTIDDVLWLADGGHRRWSHPRTETVHTHGSGCTLSTAVAAGLAKGMSLINATEAAVQTTSRLIDLSAAGGLVNSNGPLLHFKIAGPE